VTIVGTSTTTFRRSVSQAFDISGRYGRAMATCSRGRILHTDGTVAGCTNDDTDDCAGLDERHEGDPVCTGAGSPLRVVRDSTLTP
jgi:hypothetical protein